MWEDRKLEYPGLDTSVSPPSPSDPALLHLPKKVCQSFYLLQLFHPIVGHCGLFEDYLDLGVRAIINPEIRCYLEKAEDGATNREETELGVGVAGLGIERGYGEEDAEGEVVEEDENGDGK